MKFLKKRSFRAFALTLAVMFALGTVTALANSDEVVVKVYDISAGTIVAETTYGRTTLENSTEFKTIGFHHYSSKTGGSNPTYREFTAKGPTIYEILSKSGIDVSTTGSIGNITIDSNDGYSATISGRDLLNGERYYYEQNATTPTAIVPAILATKAARGYKTNADQLADSNTLRLFFGQRAPDERVMNKFVKNTAVITVEVP